MKVLVVSHSAVVPIYREKLHLLAEIGCDLHLVVPPGWPEGGRCVLAPAPGKELGITIHRLPARFVGKVGGFHLLGLSSLLKRVEPDIIHIEEEPYSILAWQAQKAALKHAIPMVFFTWENILRSYKLPLRWIDQWVLKHCRWAIAGNQEAAGVLVKRGFQGRSVVIPQYGVNPEFFRPFPVLNIHKPVFTLGYFGRLCEEKGLLTLFRAVQELEFSWQMVITGAGPDAEALRQKTVELGLDRNITFVSAVKNEDMPKALQQLDVLILPSQTTPTWKEQFGRVLIEAMACEIPVIGSDSGEIPNVIGSAGLIFPEGDWKSLANRIIDLHSDMQLTHALGQQGRQRVLLNYTSRQIAKQTLQFYEQILQKD